MDLFYLCRKSLRIRRGRGLLANDNPAFTRKSRRIVGVFILGICAIRALGIKNRIIRYSIFHSILDTCISPKYRLSGQRFIRYSIHRSITIPPSIDIECSQVSRYLDISSIEPALSETSHSEHPCLVFKHPFTVNTFSLSHFFRIIHFKKKGRNNPICLG